MESSEDSATFAIKSFVFLELETTHLYPTQKPKIIELSLIAVNRTGLLSSDVHTALSCAKKEDSTFDLLPRIIDKLTLCVDPTKYSSQTSARITKLDKRKLDKNKKLPFDKDMISMINIFLSRQEAPVCMVAHNGLRFDFPLLRSELSQLPVEGNLPADLYCVDSLSGFKAGFTEVKRKRKRKRKRKSDTKGPKDTEGPEETKGPKEKFGLADIFERTFGTKPPNSNFAESDAMSLIKVLLPNISEFVSWADKHATLFKDGRLYYNV